MVSPSQEIKKITDFGRLIFECWFLGNHVINSSQKIYLSFKFVSVSTLLSFNFLIMYMYRLVFIFYFST